MQFTTLFFISEQKTQVVIKLILTHFRSSKSINVLRPHGLPFSTRLFLLLQLFPHSFNFILFVFSQLGFSDGWF